ncbi:uncharacterized protein LOC129050794 [Pongo abelii]|uniref:uncharacterized protein LOC129050794 n=1 Tax=Pongo abelii TaxID=9601 RepID=UPI0023E83229|nr:uncharacterized protein LOC129050794 [Pongo abelii]
MGQRQTSAGSQLARASASHRGDLPGGLFAQATAQPPCTGAGAQASVCEPSFWGGPGRATAPWLPVQGPTAWGGAARLEAATSGPQGTRGQKDTWHGVKKRPFSPSMQELKAGAEGSSAPSRPWALEQPEELCKSFSPRTHIGISPALIYPLSFQCMSSTAYLAPDASDAHQHQLKPAYLARGFLSHGRIVSRGGALVFRLCFPCSPLELHFQVGSKMAAAHPGSHKIKSIPFFQWSLLKYMNTFPRSSAEEMPAGFNGQKKVSGHNKTSQQQVE